MADSADDLLDRLRKAARIWETTACQDMAEVGGQMAEAFGALDFLLTSGGPLPTDWAAKPDEGVRPVQEVPLTESRAAVREAALDAYARQNADVHRENMRLHDEIAELREQVSGGRIHVQPGSDGVPLHLAPADTTLPWRHALEHYLGRALEGITKLREEIAQDRMRLSGLAAENARLKAELDMHGGRNVLLCMDRDAQAAMDASRGERAGTILRLTDTGIEYELDDGGLWTRRSSLASRGTHMIRGARALARVFRGKPGAPGAAARALTALSLELAVPQAIGCLRAEPDCALALAAEWQQMIADYGEALAVLAARDQAAFDRLARGIAALALRPGGVTYCGRLWEADSTGTV